MADDQLEQAIRYAIERAYAAGKVHETTTDTIGSILDDTMRTFGTRPSAHREINRGTIDSWLSASRESGHCVTYWTTCDDCGEPWRNGLPCSGPKTNQYPRAPVRQP